MRCIAAGLAFNAAAAAGFIAGVFAYKNSVARLGLDEGAVNAGMLARAPVLFIDYPEHIVKSRNDCVLRYQAFAVIGEDGGNSDRIAHRRADESAIEM